MLPWISKSPLALPALVAAVSLSACGPGLNINDDSTTTADAGYSTIRMIDVQKAVVSGTPASLRPSSSSPTGRIFLPKSGGRTRSPEMLADCAPGDTACEALAAVQERFFTSGPLTLSSITASTTDRISEAFGNPKAYIPCLDPSNSEGGTMFGMSYPAQEVRSYTFASPDGGFSGDGSSFDPQVDFQLSCVQSNAAGSYPTWTAYGRDDDGTFYILDGAPEGDEDSPYSNSTLSIIDPQQNIDVWHVVRGVDPAFAWSAGSHENYAAGAGETYPQSAAVIHARRDASANRLELTATGAGIGFGCGVHIQTDGQFLYVKANLNFDGNCYAEDQADWAATGTVSPFDASLVDQEFCYDVTDETTIAETSLGDCTAAGLGHFLVDDGDDTELLSTLSLASLERARASGNDELRMINAYNVLELFQDDVTTLPAFQKIEPSDADTVDLDDALGSAIEEESDGEFTSESVAELASVDTFFSPDVTSASLPTAMVYTNPWSAGFCRDRNGGSPVSMNVDYVINWGLLTTDEKSAIANSAVKTVRFNVSNGYTTQSAYQTTPYKAWANFTGATVQLLQNGSAVSGVSAITVSKNFTDAQAGDALAASTDERIFVLPSGFSISAGTDPQLAVRFTVSHHYMCDTGTVETKAVAVRPSLGSVRLTTFQ